ncbi:MAG: hypothetical protein ACQEXX_01455 [Bacillota bacterium]
MSAFNCQNEVDNIIEEHDDTYTLQQDPTWKITSLELAVWADEKLHELEVKISEVEKVADSNIDALKAKIEKLELWKEEATKKEKDNTTFFKEHLHLYHQRVMEEQMLDNEKLIANDKKPKKITKTIKLPYRDLTCKSQSPSILINGKEPAKAKDDEVFLKYVKENNPEFIKTVEEVKWGDFKDTLKTTVLNGKLVYVDDAGSPINFITLAERRDKYDWRLK